MSKAQNRRHFIAKCLSAGATSTLLPGILWAKMSDEGTDEVTVPMVKAAAALAGLDFSDKDCQDILDPMRQHLAGFKKLHKFHIPYTVRPPVYFSPVVPGMKVNRAPAVFRMSPPPAVTRPANLEDASYWPVTHLAQLMKSRQVSSVELTGMYLARLERCNEKLNCVVTYPALATLNGFGQDGAPTSITFVARPYGEAELFAVAKAYQDACGYTSRHPAF